MSPTTIDGFTRGTLAAAQPAAPVLNRVEPRSLETETLLTGRIHEMVPRHGSRDAGRAPADPGTRDNRQTPLEVLEERVLAALLRPPCLVTFSGGMDSTFVLAVALRVAQRHGLPLPVPVSWRFPEVAQADESGLQDALLRELGVSERLSWSVTDELDLIGPVASRLLARSGPAFPANLHLHLPMVEVASGGSILTGWGGDQVLGAWSRQRWPRPRPVLLSGWSALPPALRAVTPLRHRDRAADFPWLTSAAAARVARSSRGRPRNAWSSPDRRLASYRRSQSEVTCSYNLAALGTFHNVLVVSPLYDPAFVDSLLRTLPRGDVLSRGDVMAAISDGTLPSVICRDRSKARFGDVVVNAHSTAFARSWDGTGIGSPDVDFESLQQIWSGGEVPMGTEFLLQQAWSHELRTRAVIRTTQEQESSAPLH